MENRFPLLIRKVVFPKISGGCVNSIGDRSKGFMNSLGIYDREKCFKVLVFNVTQRYDSTQRFVITDVELRKFGGEKDRVPREKVSMNTVKCTVDL